MKETRVKCIRRIMSGALSMVMAVSLVAAVQHPEKVYAAGGKELRNPQITEDLSMGAEQEVTWDCVWFGNYPQSEVKEGDSVYGWLKDAAGWDSNNDILINGTKYRRMKMGDATFATSGNSSFYEWDDSDTYHYFRYEPVKWRVLKVKGNTALILSDIVLDDRQYNTEYESVTWESTTIRSWLNGYGKDSNKANKDYSNKNFIDSAFSLSEQDAILNTVVVNNDNIDYGTEGGSNTKDKIFLLSESEVYTDAATVHGFVSEKYTDDEGKVCKISDYAKAMGAAEMSDGNCQWWLRSAGETGYNAVNISDYGYVSDSGFSVDYECNGVRAALNLNVSSYDCYTYAGTVSSNGTKNETGKPTPEYPAAEKAPKKGTKLIDKKTKAVYKVTKSGIKNGTVEYVKPTSLLKKAAIPSAVKINRITYKVTSISPKAFKNNKKLVQISIGSNVKNIGSLAFYGCKNLKKILINTTSLTAKTVGKNVFKGIYKKAVIKVPKKKYNSYKAILKKSGISKTVKITK